MTFTIPGEEPVGYTYRAENYPAQGTSNDDDVLVALLNGQVGKPDYALRSIVILDAMSSADSTETILRRLAEHEGIEYDDPRSYDSDVFPKPIYADQLTCSDQEWTELAPRHTFEFIPRADGATHCILCGIEELRHTRKEPTDG